MGAFQSGDHHPAGLGETPLRASMLIDGCWESGVSGKTFEVLDPATGGMIGVAPEGTGEDVDQAVASARRAFERGVWSELKPAERAKILWRVADLIDRDAERIATLDTRNNGMPLAMARSIVAGGAEAFRYFAGWCTKIHGITSEISFPGSFHSYTLKEPVGVVGLIVPWNGPFLFACTKIAPALAAGCTCVLKPAEETPLTALLLGELLIEAGVPPGVVNIITGLGHVVGAALVEHKDVDKISFTGSTAVGRSIIAASAGNFKRLTLELGGKSPVIVLPDADMESTIAGVANGIFVNSGQICVAGSRAYVHRSIHQRVADGVGEIARAIRLGSGLDEASQLGPLISAKQRERVAGMVSTASRANIIAGGASVDGPGFYFQPTVLQGLAEDSLLMRQEIFGPVIAMTPFDDEDDVVARANDTPFGLAAQVWTRDVSAAHRITKRIRAGTVWVNCALVSDYSMPFGGYKQSGWGREWGQQGVDSFLETKSVFSSL